MGTHVIMKKSLAKALLDAGVEHFDAGGAVGGNGQTQAGGVGGFISGLSGGQSGFQATNPVIDTQNLKPRIGTLQNEQDQLYGQQQSLAQTLLAQSRGQGPNPALNELNQQTGNNVAATAALIAGARGASANPGLAAELAARQGAATQQQAVGQAATLQAEQELGAQKTAGDIITGQAGQALQGEGIEQGAQAAQNTAETTGQLGAEEANAQIATANAANAGSAAGGILGGLGSFLGLYKGGKVPRYADGGFVNYATPTDPHVQINVPSPTTSPMQKGITALGGGLGKALMSRGSAPGPGYNTAALPGTDGVNPLELDVSGAPTSSAGGFAGLAGDAADAVAAAPELAVLAARGGAIPGRAQVAGDSPKNDTVPAILSPGEEVLPRSVTQAPDAPERAKRFVEALQEKKGKGKGYAEVVKARSLKDRVARLEKLCSGGMA